MNVLAKMTTMGAALAFTVHPCVAAAAEGSSGTVAATQVASGAGEINFNLKRHAAGAGQRGIEGIASASLSLAASQQTAYEAEDRPRRRGPSTTTWLVVGGVALLVLVAVAVASAAPTPGPSEGAFD